jgi:hypothetical protein
MVVYAYNNNNNNTREDEGNSFIKGGLYKKRTDQSNCFIFFEAYNNNSIIHKKIWMQPIHTVY